MNIDNLKLEAIALSAKIALIEQQNKEVFERWRQLQAELKAIENKLQPPMNFELY